MEYLRNYYSTKPIHKIYTLQQQYYPVQTISSFSRRMS